MNYKQIKCVFGPNLNFKAKMKKGILKYCLSIIGFLISDDGFIITKTLFAKFVCNSICNGGKKILVNLGKNFYIINK